MQNAMTLIDAIGTVTEESGPAIEAARKAYDALNSDEKALVTNYETLTAAETAFTQLSASIDYRYYAVKASELMGTNYWTNSVSATPLSGGGIHFGFKDSGTNMRQGINRPLKLDGLASGNEQSPGHGRRPDCFLPGRLRRAGGLIPSCCTTRARGMSPWPLS